MKFDLQNSAFSIPIDGITRFAFDDRPRLFTRSEIIEGITFCLETSCKNLTYSTDL